MLDIDGYGWSCCRCSVSNEEIDLFARVSSDHNELHYGPGRIAHGALLLAKLSAAITGRFGHGTVMLGETTLKVGRPVKPDECFYISIGPLVPVEKSKLKLQTADVLLYGWSGSQRKDIISGSVSIKLPTVERHALLANAESIAA